MAYRRHLRASFSISTKFVFLMMALEDADFNTSSGFCVIPIAVSATELYGHVSTWML